MRNLWLFFASLLLVSAASGQVSINTNLTTGTMTSGVANLYRTAYLHFQLVNCGDNIPVMPGQPNAVIQDSFDLRPATPGSAIVGEIIGNDQITCGNVISTYYEVTAMKDASHPLRNGIPYVICSASAGISTCGNAASLGAFNLITADPMSQPPPAPGFTEIYGNPTNSQTINQPINGIGGWSGLSTSFTFTNGLTLGPVTTAQLSLLTGFTTMVMTSDSVPGSNPCTGGGTGALALYLNGQWSCAGGSGGGGGGTLTGGGTGGNFAGWTGPTALGNAPCNFSGLNVSCPGSFSAAGTFTLGTVGTDACGAATSCEVLVNSTGSVVPAAGYYTRRCFGGTCYLSLNGGAEFLSAMNFPVQGSDSAVASAGAISSTPATPACSDANGGVTTTGCLQGLPSSTQAQVGDTLRYNVNGDGNWDAVNYAQKFTIANCDSGTAETFGTSNQGPGTVGSLTLVNPTGVDAYACKYAAAATASTNTVIGIDQGTGGNSSLYGWGSWYRFTARFAANNTTNVRYWIGMSVWLNDGPGSEGEALLGTAKLATNTPNSTTLAFRYSAGTDTTWQATSQITSGSQTIVSTTVAIDTNPHFFEIVPVGTTALFFIDHVLVATVTSNVPTSSQDLMAMVWSGDNEDTNTAIAGTMYYMSLSTR
jgi:hypothetical protein